MAHYCGPLAFQVVTYLAAGNAQFFHVVNSDFAGTFVLSVASNARGQPASQRLSLDFDFLEEFGNKALLHSSVSSSLILEARFG